MAVTAVLAFPVLYGILQSLYRPEELGAPAEWVGLQNYIDTFGDPDFSNALYRTTVYAVGSMLLATALGLFFSFALYKVVGRLRVLRSVTLAPYLISSVAAAVMFRILFNGQFGLVNVTLSGVGVDGPDWFAEPRLGHGRRHLHAGVDRSPADDPSAPRRPDDHRPVISRRGAGRRCLGLATGPARDHPDAHPQLLINTIWLSYSTVTGLGIVLPLTGGGPRAAPTRWPWRCT